MGCTPYCGFYFLQEFAAQQNWRLSSELYEALPYDKTAVFLALVRKFCDGDGTRTQHSGDKHAEEEVIGPHFLRYKDEENLYYSLQTYYRKNKDDNKFTEFLLGMRGDRKVRMKKRVRGSAVE